MTSVAMKAAFRYLNGAVLEVQRDKRRPAYVL